MLEKEIVTVTEIESKCMESIAISYPQMYLSPPLLPEEMYSYVEGMNSYEKEFVKLLHSRGMIVFREPMIESIDCKPDFFIFNPYTQKGKIVEITLCEKNYSNGNRDTVKRKRRQAEKLEQTGIPYVILYRENLERIRRTCCENLF